jgi:hypothetical protein
MHATERMFRLLVRTIAARFPQYRTEPFTVEELQGTILPYRLHRRDLGLETNQDYEMALTELLSGVGGYLMVDDRMRDALQRELAGSNPDPGAFRAFAGSRVSLSPQAVAEAERAPADAPAPPVRPTEPRISQGNAPASGDNFPSTGGRRLTPAGRQRTVVAPEGSSCAYCAGALPVGREITFCPHCGQNLTVMRCSACGTELEVGWKFCTTCGKAAGA